MRHSRVGSYANLSGREKKVPRSFGKWACGRDFCNRQIWIRLVFSRPARIWPTKQIMSCIHHFARFTGGQGGKRFSSGLRDIKLVDQHICARPSIQPGLPSVSSPPPTASKFTFPFLGAHVDDKDMVAHAGLLRDRDRLHRSYITRLANPTP